ncbi:MAG: hypothetical protein ACFCVE_09595 [Phycisphaerae bacterium]
MSQHRDQIRIDDENELSNDLDQQFDRIGEVLDGLVGKEDANAATHHGAAGNAAVAETARRNEQKRVASLGSSRIIDAVRGPRTATRNGRTGLEDAQLADGAISLIGPDDKGAELKVRHVVLQGVSFRSPTPLKPGDYRFLKTGTGGDAKLASGIRIVSCRLRSDGEFDIGAQFY